MVRVRLADAVILNTRGRPTARSHRSTSSKSKNTMHHTRFVHTIAIFAAGALATGLRAQSDTAPTNAPADPPAREDAGASVPPVESPTQLVPRPSAAAAELTLDVRPRFEYTFEAALDDAATDVSITRTGLMLDLSIPTTERFRLALNTDFEASWYSFDADSPGGLFDDPFDDVYRLRLAPGFFYAVNQQWGVLGGGIVEFAGESDADIGDSTTYGGYVGARYAFSDGFAMTGGIQAKTRIEDNALFLPIIGFEWKVTPKVTLSTSGPGVGLRLNTVLSDEWSFSLGASWEPRDYRLADDSPIPDGIARDERVPVIAGFVWKPAPTISLSAYGGAIVWQELSIDDSGGDQLIEDNTDPTGFVGFSASFRF